MMQHLPIAAHIAVVNAAPGVPGEGAGLAPAVPTPEGGTDFSNLLAAQLAVKVETLARQGGALAADGAASDAASQQASDAPPGLTVIAFLPFAAPAQPASPGAAEAAPHGRPGLAELSRALEPPAEGSPKARAAGLAVEARPAAAQPANFAATVADLPARVALGSGADEALAEPTLRPAATPQVAAGEIQPMAAAWQVHGVAGAKAETGSGSAAPGAAAVSVSVEARVGSAGWGSELGQKVVWLANQQQQIAHINVTPPQLGPIEIRLNLAQDQASASFVSPHPAVREAIEAALPRLREMLAESGLTLANVDVSAHSFGHARQEQGLSHSPRSFVADPTAAPAGLAGPTPGLPAGGGRAGHGLVDVFA